MILHNRRERYSILLKIISSRRLPECKGEGGARRGIFPLEFQKYIRCPDVFRSIDVRVGATTDLVESGVLTQY